MELTLLISFPFFIHFFIPPSKNPRQLSNPILESLVMASFSLPRLQIRIILVLISFIISPTHGANLPSSPINIEFLMCDLI